MKQTNLLNFGAKRPLSKRIQEEVKYNKLKRGCVHYYETKKGKRICRYCYKIISGVKK